VARTPEVATLLTAFGPQISVNFGSRAGWSYLSAGIGSATIRTRRGAFTDPARPNEITPAQLIDSGNRSSINVGGGARWFARTHLAFSFDVRFHMARAGGDPATPGTTVVAVGAGVSLK
jgi:hypothetical protein